MANKQLDRISQKIDISVKRLRAKLGDRIGEAKVFTQKFSPEEQSYYFNTLGQDDINALIQEFGVEAWMNFENKMRQLRNV